MKQAQEEVVLYWSQDPPKVTPCAYEKREGTPCAYEERDRFLATVAITALSLRRKFLSRTPGADAGAPPHFLIPPLSKPSLSESPPSLSSLLEASTFTAVSGTGTGAGCAALE